MRRQFRPRPILIRRAARPIFQLSRRNTRYKQLFRVFCFSFSAPASGGYTFTYRTHTITRKILDRIRGRGNSSLGPIREGVAGQHPRGFLTESGAVDFKTYIQYTAMARRVTLAKETQIREDILHLLANICTTMITQIATTQHRSVVGRRRPIGGRRC